MKLNIKEIINKEIVHYADGDRKVFSQYRTIFYQIGNEKKIIQLPESLLKKPFGYFRLTRRALRLDKCNVYVYKDDLIIIRQGKVYLYESKKDRLTHTLMLANCRNILHQSICVNPEGFIYFGEYGANPKRETVHVYCSKDGGQTWTVVYTFPAKSIKHIHGCYYDKFSDKIWVCTGDYEGENRLLIADKDFKEIRRIGDGSYSFRTCNFIFSQNEVHWLMDSPFEPSYHMVWDRKTEKVSKRQKLMGPVMYIKELKERGFLAATVQEIGKGVLDDKVYLYFSLDLMEWKVLAKFDHDGLPKRYFKFGVIGFAEGAQALHDFFIFFEAIKGYDGKTLRCSIQL